MTSPNYQNHADRGELLVTMDSENRKFRRVSANDAKTNRKHRALIDRICDLKRSQSLTPAENRYVDKRVRELLGLQMQKRGRKLPTYLLPVEAAHLIGVARERSTLDGILIEFLIKTGLRIGEATSVLVQDLELSSHKPYVRVIQGKGSKDRNVPLTSDLAHKITLYLGGRRYGPLFARKNEKPYSKRRLQERVSDSIKACGFERNIRVHDLRHTFATILRSRSFKLQDIQMLMGHSSIKTTEVYAHLILTDEQQLEFQQVMQL